MKRHAILIAALLLSSCSGSQNSNPLRSMGTVCGDPDIRGEFVGKVQGSGAGCGFENGVRVSSINGVLLSQPSLMRCETARGLKSWMSKGMRKAVGDKGGGVAQIQVAAHYACRTRNHQAGAKLSEHAKGNAIDISGFRLRDGSEISVEQHWGKGKYGRILKKMHKSACGKPFGTVLGPNSDAHHRDHFHFDIARHGNGAYCR